MGASAAAQTAAAQAAPDARPVKKKPEPPKPAPTPAPSQPVVTVTGTNDDAAVVPSVTVAAERPTNRVDRQVYDVKSDVGTSNNSAADALGNVPSVNVDPDGTVSLRGNTNVQIMVDGKPSAMFQGENRGAALNSLPADDLESIEVINNPGAQFGNEGGGGPILNLVMRRNKRPGGMGALNANAGVGGRYNTSLSGSYNTGPLSLQGGVNFRHDGRDSTTETQRERINPATGEITRSSQSGTAKGLNDSAGIRGAIGYNIGERDKLGADWSYNKASNDQDALDRYRYFGMDDALVSDYLRANARQGHRTNGGWSTHVDHKGDLDGEMLKFDFRVSSSDNDAGSTYANTYLVSDGKPDSRARQASVSNTRITDFTGDYERPLGGGVLKTGFKVADNVSSYDTDYVNIDPLSLAETVNPSRTNQFEADEKNYALYGSYQWRLNENWSAVTGLRSEYTQVAIHNRTSLTDGENSYLRFIPSLYLSYKASDKTNLRFMYANRIQRPNVNDLNPYVIYRDDFNVSAGNPKLKPTKIDLYELATETSLFGLDANLRGYLRHSSDLITSRSYFIGDNVLLTTRDNSGSNNAGGLEFTLSGKITPHLTLNGSGNLGYNEQTIFLGMTQQEKRKLTSLSTRLRINYQLTDDDSLQVMLNRQGKSLAGQGYRLANSTANVSFRHALTPRLSLALNVTDVFNSNRIETITDSDVVHDVSVRKAAGRVAYLGLSYRFGGITPKPRGERKEHRPDGGDGPGHGGMGRGGPPGGEGGPGF